MSDASTREREAEIRELEAQLLLLESFKASGRRALVPALRPTSLSGPLPPSFAQERLWLIDRLLPGSPLYNIPSAVALEGEIQAAVLARCLNEIVHRHAVLRTTFEPAEGGCVQVVARVAAVLLPVVDLQALSPTLAAYEVRRLAVAEAGRAFDLRRGPLLRSTLLRRGGADHVLLFTLHHIVSDAWSAGLLVRELVAIYQAVRAGRPSPLRELPIQYGDFAVWQRQWLSGEVLEREVAYWRQRLSGMPERLGLPTDRPHPRLQTFRGAGRSVGGDRSMAALLAELARAEGATLFMVLLAAFQLLLARYSAQEDFGIGTPVAGRSRREAEELIGFFVNTVVVRADLAGAASFRELLGRVRQTTLEAYDHQHLPFEKLVQKLMPQRSLAHSPLFQVMFNHEAALPQVVVPGLTVRPLEPAGRAAKFDLTLSTAGGAESLVTSLLYNRDLFDLSTAIRLLGHWQTLLAAIVADPDRPIAALPLASAAEVHALVHEWSTAGEDHLQGPTRSLPELFAAQVVARPDAPALSFAGGVWSYRELNRQADRLSHRLRRLGVGPYTRVAVCLERAPEMVIALLAILKAGGAYLPIDPAYPREHKAFLLADSGAAWLLTRTDLPGAFPAHGVRVLCLDREPEEGEPVGEGAPARAVAEAPAYVIYTSGSTGRPKGVLVPHTNVVRLFAATEARFGFGPADVWTLFHSYAFDFSVWELWGALLHGGRLVIVPPAVTRSPDVFYRLVCEAGVTVLNQTPSAFSQLVWAEEEAARLRSGAPRELALRLVIFGGEALEIAGLAPWLARHGDERPQLVNMYGITETTVHVTYRRLQHADLAAHGSAIGRPLPDLALYLLGPGLQPMPMGVPGEVHVAGAGLAVGYLGRPDLTAERFIPDPFATAPAGARLYRTGDLARYRVSGEIEYLGRIDNQVKIRGFRIELGEIEAALAAFPEVREAVVLVREGTDGDRRLVAYVVRQDGRGLSPAELRRALGERLPAHMVPAAIVMLDRLPLTANGKLDRKALPDPQEAAPGHPTDSPAPLGPVEELIGEIYGEVLGLGAIARDADFFVLGGHSLLATQVISRLHRTFGVELPLLTLFESPTVAGLAERVEAALRGGQAVAAPPIERIPRSGELPLSFAQQRLWFLDRLEPGLSVHNISLTLELSGRLDLPLLALVLEEIVRRHEVLRTRIETVEGRPRQVIARPSPVALPVLDVSGLPVPSAEARRLAEAEVLRPFDLARRPLLRATLLRLAEEEHAALLTLHHIVADGWSMGILVQELAELYQAFSAGRPSPLTELPIQYVDFASWQRRWLSGEILERQLLYWQERLAGAPVLDLPMARPRPAEPSHRGARRPLRLAAGLTAELARLARLQGGTIFMVLLAAFQALLARYSGQEDLSVGTPIAGRNRLETEGLIGLFVNSLVLRTDLSGDPSFRALLDRVRTVTLGAYAHQDLPFERLVDALQLERSASHNPLFQVMLAWQNTPLPAVALPGLALAPFPVERGTAQFDLLLSLREGEGSLAGWLEYATERFDGATALRLIAHFERLLSSAAGAPESRLADLTLLTAAERSQLIVEWSTIRERYEDGPSLHELLETQAARRPAAIAVVCDEQRLSYGELDARADRLAQRLRDLGVEPESVVGVCLKRSLELVIALLAVLKAGGAYLPLDPAHPPERRAWLLDDSRALALITERSLDDPSGGRPRVYVGEEPVPPMPTDRLCPRAIRGNAAYVIYTSGSTGRPKGVVVPHANVVRLFTATQDGFDFGPDDSWTLFHSFAFDFSVWEIWGALLLGGRLVVVPHLTSRTPDEFLELLCRERITVLNQTPSAFDQLVQALELWQRPDLALRWVIFGGEALRLRNLLPWWECYGAQSPRLVNMYGITETTVHVTYRCLAPADAAGHPGSWIGQPIPDLRVHVLDSRQQPVPIGAPGELYVGGPGLARGYLRRPSLTAERFVPDRFGTLHNTPGERLYRSGDLVRFRPSGELEYLGRIDHQVKIRGFRIEPGEIEEELRRHPAVRNAVVVALAHRGAERRLVAYVVAEPGERPTEAALRSFLRARLPEHMVPAMFVPVGSLPLTANGKVDVGALPAPGEAPGVVEERPARPASWAEMVLAGIWAEVLGREQVGVHDNFFELGGDSILTIQIVARANQAGIKLVPRQVFQHPTISELAAAAGLMGTVEAEQGLVTGPLPLTPIQRWFLEGDPVDPHHFNQALLLATTGLVSPRQTARIVESLVLHHDMLRLRVSREPEGWRQWISAPGPVPFHRVDLSRLTPGAWPANVEAAAARLQRSLDLAHGPLLRAVFFDLGGAAGARLLLVVHHLAVDGVSWRILLDDLGTAYRQLSQGEVIQLPAKTTSFKRWAELLVEHARSDAVRAEAEYWQDEVRRRVLPLPIDGEKWQGTGPFRTVSVALGTAETESLVQDVPASSSAQVEEVLLTALLWSLHRWTGESLLLVDMEGHGRDESFAAVDLTRTVGWFTTIYPLLADLGSPRGPEALLPRVKHQLRSVPAHGIGYGLVRYLGDAPSRALLASFPQADVAFNYLGRFDGVLTQSAAFQPAPESHGPTRSLRGKRRHLVEVSVWVADRRLAAGFVYSESVHHAATIERLASEFLVALRALIDSCRQAAPEKLSATGSQRMEVLPSELEQALAEVEFEGIEDWDEHEES